MKGYMERIAEIGAELERETPGEIESRLGISRFDYTGVGFGYNLKDNYPKNRMEAEKDIAAPEFQELVRFASELRI
jgi:hypothetical protein